MRRVAAHREIDRHVGLAAAYLRGWPAAVKIAPSDMPLPSSERERGRVACAASTTILPASAPRTAPRKVRDLKAAHVECQRSCSRLSYCRPSASVSLPIASLPCASTSAAARNSPAYREIHSRVRPWRRDAGTGGRNRKGVHRERRCREVEQELRARTSASRRQRCRSGRRSPGELRSSTCSAGLAFTLAASAVFSPAMVPARSNKGQRLATSDSNEATVPSSATERRQRRRETRRRRSTTTRGASTRASRW